MPKMNGERMIKPHTIHPTRIYTVQHVRAALGLADNTITSEIRQGRLRVSRRAGRYYFLGEWLLQWIRDGEVRCPPCSGACAKPQQDD